MLDFEICFIFVVLFCRLAVMLHSKHHCSDLTVDANNNQRQIFLEVSKSPQIVVTHETNVTAQFVSSQMMFVIQQTTADLDTADTQ